MKTTLDLLLLLEAASRLNAYLPPDLMFIRVGGLDSEAPADLNQFRLHRAWLNSWADISEDSQRGLATAAGFTSPSELLNQIVSQALSITLARSIRTYGDSAKVDGLHRRAIAGGQAQ